MDVFLLSGTAEQNQLYERQPWQKLVLIFLVELIGTAILMLFGCIGLVPKHPGGEVGEYNGAIGFAGIVAVIIVVSILLIYTCSILFIDYNFSLNSDYWSHQ